MRPEDEEQVREIYQLCHPALSARPPFWYFAHPTIVFILAGQVAGFTSFTLTVMPGFGSTLYGMDVCVKPGFRGQGIADALHDMRLALGRGLGATTFMGVCNKNNIKMATILRRAGAHVCLATSDQDVLFVSPIKGA